MLTVNSNHIDNHNKGGEHMTDSEKFELILSKLEKLDKIENDIKDIKLTLENKLRKIKAKIEMA